MLGLITSMKVFNYICIFLLLVALIPSGSSQNMERKIVIQNQAFFYTTIDPEFQLATLHSGKANEALKSAKNFALPAGRNYSDPINPFCWDISGANFFAVNWLNHPMNDRNEALKLFPLKGLKDWSESVTTMNVLTQSMDYNTFADNVPYQFVLKKSNVLHNFFFDAIRLNDSTTCMAINNNGFFSYWVYNGKAWDHLEINNLSVDGFFTLISVKQNVYLVLSSGAVYEISTKQLKPLPEKSLKTGISEGVFVIDKDNNTVKFITNNQLDLNKPLHELLKKTAIQVF